MLLKKLQQILIQIRDKELKMQRDLGNKIVLVGGGNILMEVMLSISGNI